MVQALHDIFGGEMSVGAVQGICERASEAVDPAVEPTNNDAECALRPAVLWRKGSFGIRSDAGSTLVARMRTVFETARRRGVRPVEWLSRACRAATLGLPPPPLLTA